MRCEAATCIVLLALFGLNLQAQELVVQYKFDRDRSVAADFAGPIHNRGRLGGTARRLEDTPGMASPYAIDLSAAGSQSWVSTGRLSDTDQMTSFTITTWVKLKGLNTDHGGDLNPRLFSNKHNEFEPGFTWALDSPNQGDRSPANFRSVLRVEGERDDVSVFSDEDLSAVDWTFLAVTYDGSSQTNNAAFYYGDETKETSLLGNVESLDAGVISGISSFRSSGIGFAPIDRNASEQSDYSVNGLQDDVRFYSGVVPLDQLDAIRLENLVPVGEETKIDCDPNTGGDVDDDGKIGFSDFLIMSKYFGEPVDSHEQGDIDCNGFVEFSDFIIQSTWFGKAAPVVAVPETNSLTLSAIASIGILSLRRRRLCSPFD